MRYLLVVLICLGILTPAVMQEAGEIGITYQGVFYPCAAEFMISPIVAIENCVPEEEPVETAPFGIWHEGEFYPCDPEDMITPPEAIENCVLDNNVMGDDESFGNDAPDVIRSTAPVVDGWHLNYLRDVFGASHNPFAGYGQ